MIVQQKSGIALLTPFFLVGANLVPLFGVLLFGWSVFDVLAIFWLENVAIGVINVLKMLSWPVLNRKHGAAVSAVLGGVFTVPFFIFHYGIFTTVHGIFIVTLFGDGALEQAGEMMMASGFPLFAIFDVVASEPGMAYAALGLFASHFFSYLVNFVILGEHQKTTPKELMAAPYARVIMLHFTIILGGFLVMSLQDGQLWALALLIFLKTAFDMTLHLREHRGEEKMEEKQ